MIHQMKWKNIPFSRKFILSLFVCKMVVSLSLSLSHTNTTHSIVNRIKNCKKSFFDRLYSFINKGCKINSTQSQVNCRAINVRQHRDRHRFVPHCWHNSPVRNVSFCLGACTSFLIVLEDEAAAQLSQNHSAFGLSAEFELA